MATPGKRRAQSASDRSEASDAQKRARDVSANSGGGRFAVLSGRHDGALAPLAGASTLVGAGAECDIILDDTDLLPLHALVLVSEGGAPRVRWFGAGGETAPQEQSVQWFEPLRFGTVWAAAVPADFAWERASKPIKPAAPRPAADQKRSERGPALRFVLTMAAALPVAAALLALITILGTLRPASAQLGADEAGVRLREVVAELKLADVTVDTTAQSPSLTGFVDTFADFDRLAHAARAALHRDVALRVKVGSDLVTRTREFLGDTGIEVGYEGGGRLRLAGRPETLRTRGALQERIGQLRTDLGPTVELEDAIDATALNGFGAPVELALPVRIAEVQADEPAHFRTTDGARYFLGARLPDGAEVVRIGSTEILFRKDGREIVYSVVD